MPARTPIRTLLVDDSSALRRALSEALQAEPDVEVVGSAATVRSALARIEELSPDVIITKFDMPDRGLSLLRSLHQASRAIPVVVFDVEMTAGSPRNFDARLAGAVACVVRPVAADLLADAVRDSLAPALRAHCVQEGGRVRKSTCPTEVVSPRTSPSDRPGTDAVPLAKSGPVSSRSRCEPASIVAIASSTGGPDALVAVLSKLPKDFSLPIVIVQHMPPEFVNSLAERLATQTGRRVLQAHESARLDDAAIWIAPGGRHLLVERTDRTMWLRLSDSEPENSCRPSADVLFRSVAAAFGARSLAVVLTGMGQDGMLGSQAIRQQGGQVLVQDQATCVVGAMPRAVVEAGLADAILPLPEITAEILRRCRRSVS